MKLTRILPLSLSITALLLGGCSMIPTYTRPAVQTQANWKESTADKNAAQQGVIDAAWWQRFGSPTLSQLIETGLAQNNDVQASIARVQQARATAQVANATLLPTLDASASASSDRDAIVSSARSTNARRAGLDIGYELDLFGGNAAERASARASLKAAGFDKDATQLSLTGEIARAYFTLLNDDTRIAIAQANVANQQQVLDIVQARFSAGAISALDLAQQKSALASARSTLASLQQARAQDETALSILLGNVPQKITMAERLDTLSYPVIATTQPSQLLERRPDIRAAEQRLIAANADIGAARAAFYPTIDLGAGLAIASGSGAGSEATSLSAALLAPIFSSGRLEGNLALSKARQQELSATYRQTVLSAFSEVENALAAIKGAQTRVTELQTATTEAQKAYDISRQLYQQGATDFQTLLDSQRTLYSAQDSLVNAQLESFTAAVDLYRAMAGSWQVKTPATPITPPTASAPQGAGGAAPTTAARPSSPLSAT